MKPGTVLHHHRIRDLFDQVWQGIQTACDVGFNVKLNVVAMKGINDDEFADFARLATQRAIQVRFIEFMPIGNKDSWDRSRFISADDLKEMIATMGTMEPSPGSRLEGPARVYRLTTREGKRAGLVLSAPSATTSATSATACA